MSSDQPAEPRRTRPRRRLDVASLALLLVGLASAVFACWLVAAHHWSALVILPAVLAVILGATHLTKMQAPRDDR